VAYLVRLTDANFEREVFQSEIPLLVHLWASWCPPYKMVEPTVRELAEEHDGKTKVGKLHVDQNSKTASSYHIMGVPTFVLANSGKEVERGVGAQPKRQLNQMVSEALGRGSRGTEE